MLAQAPLLHGLCISAACLPVQESVASLGGSKPVDSEITKPLGRRRSVVQVWCKAQFLLSPSLSLS